MPDMEARHGETHWPDTSRPDGLPGAIGAMDWPCFDAKPDLSPDGPSTPGQADFFPPPAPEDAARPVGTIDGPAGWDEGFGAGLRCWLGPAIGWRDLGDLKGIIGSILFHRGRLTVGLSFDLGRHSIRRNRESADADLTDAQD